MFGVIWFVQIAHYPLFAEIPPAALQRYEAAYTNRMGYIAGPLMLAELLSGLLLLAPSLRLPTIPSAQAWWGLGLIGLLWASTAFIQVPLHSKLQSGFDLDAIRNLVVSNWIRTVAWSLRAVLVLMWVDRLATGR